MAEVNTFHIISTAAGAMFALGVGDIIRRLYRLDKKLDDQSKAEERCRLDLAENYAKWTDLTGPDGRITKIETDRRSRWDRQDQLNMHREQELTEIKTKLRLKG